MILINVRMAPIGVHSEAIGTSTVVRIRLLIMLKRRFVDELGLNASSSDSLTLGKLLEYLQTKVKKITFKKVRRHYY